MTNESVFESTEKRPHYKKMKDFIENNRSQCAKRDYKQSIEGSNFYF